MAYDEQLVSRIRKALGREPGITEKKMFGGLAFLVGFAGNLFSVGISWNAAWFPKDRQGFAQAKRAAIGIEMQGRGSLAQRGERHGGHEFLAARCYHTAH